MSDWHLNDTQPSQATRLSEPTRPISIKKKRSAPAWLVLSFFLLLYFFFPWRANLLILGIDRSPEGSSLARSDTMLLVGIQPPTADVKMLSIPRDLWVTLPQYGENRINAAHYFAEGEEPGSGPRATIAAVESSFGVKAGYYLRLRLEGFAAIVDALGGLEINLTEPRAGYPAGAHLLDGTQALAFVRDRQGDDFFRMANGQFFIQALGKALVSPQSWLRLPSVMAAMGEALDTNLPFWMWPRLGLALLRAGPDGVDAHSLDRTMVTGWTTNAGAQVLLPNWDAINPLVDELFGR